VEYVYNDVTEVSLDRETRRLEVVTGGKRVVVDGIDRLYVKSVPWSEADGTVHLKKGRVSVNGNVAAVGD
jgi:phage baseplate assembly protein gpV